MNWPVVGIIGGWNGLVYDGEAGGDSLTVLGTGSDDVILHRPGCRRMPVKWMSIAAAAGLQKTWVLGEW